MVNTAGGRCFFKGELLKSACGFKKNHISLFINEYIKYVLEGEKVWGKGSEDHLWFSLTPISQVFSNTSKLWWTTAKWSRSVREILQLKIWQLFFFVSLSLAEGCLKMTSCFGLSTYHCPVSPPRSLLLSSSSHTHCTILFSPPLFAPGVPALPPSVGSSIKRMSYTSLPELWVHSSTFFSSFFLLSHPFFMFLFSFFFL